MVVLLMTFNKEIFMLFNIDTIERTTPQAFLVKIAFGSKTRSYWLPKSHVTISDDNSEIEIAEWLVEKNNLIDMMDRYDFPKSPSPQEVPDPAYPYVILSRSKMVVVMIDENTTEAYWRDRIDLLTWIKVVRTYSDGECTYKTDLVYYNPFENTPVANKFLADEFPEYFHKTNPYKLSSWQEFNLTNIITYGFAHNRELFKHHNPNKDWDK
jgi:hypothetical protein